MIAGVAGEGCVQSMVLQRQPMTAQVQHPVEAGWSGDGSRSGAGPASGNWGWQSGVDYSAAMAMQDSNPALAMQLAMQQSYIQATQMAKSKGYHSLEAMELHKHALLKAQAKKANNPCTVFVGGLLKTTEEETVRRHFERFGEVPRADIIRNLDGTSRGFAFVKYNDEESLAKCMEAKFRHVIDDKWVDCKRHDRDRADAGKSATKAMEMAATSVGVDPSQYLNYLTHLAMVQYGYGSKKVPDDDLSPVSSLSRYQPY